MQSEHIFHKQHYKALVELVGELGEKLPENKEWIACLVSDFAYSYAALDVNGNRNFKRDRFLTACEKRLGIVSYQ